MDMAVDERRQEELAVEVDAFASRRRRPRRMHGDDETAANLDIGLTAVGKASVGETHQTRFSRLAAA